MKPIFKLIVVDYVRDQEAWRWLAVLTYEGKLAMDPDSPRCVSEEQIQDIYRFLAESNHPIARAGLGEAGQPFSNEPLLDFYQSHIVITQSGGRDV